MKRKIKEEKIQEYLLVDYVFSPSSVIVTQRQGRRQRSRRR